MSTFDPKQLAELIQYRRTIFPEQFDTERPVPDAIITEMLEAANWAPNHGSTEPWRFKVYTGSGLQLLQNLQERIYLETTPEADRNPDKLAKLLRRLGACSHAIGIFMKRDAYEKIRELEEIEAIACAVQNMHLTAAAHNVGAFWSTGGITYKPDAQKYFGFEDQDRLLGFMMIGYSKEAWPKGRRKPIADKVTWVR